jgi:hypothetical protein
VNADTTILVFHAGNHDLIGVRHRKRQTLYITNIIVPWACQHPGYGKIQVGIYIAAIRDALDRLKVEDQEESTAAAQEAQKQPDGDGHGRDEREEPRPRRRRRGKYGGRLGRWDTVAGRTNVPTGGTASLTMVCAY